MEAKLLNNIAGSTGYTNLWIYSTDDTKALVDVAGFFNAGIDYGMHEGDMILLKLSDFNGWAYLAIAGGVVTLTALDIYA